MSSGHANISIFVPHIGCPNRCSFCDQRFITGSRRAPRSEDVVEAVRNAVKSKNYSPENTEIAFFGGSFTAINRTYMVHLLQTASAFVDNGVVKGIRISTRPDAINNEILTLLDHYHVTAIELGAQSLDDRVLCMNNRGHTVADVEKASKLIKKFGIELGLQMMTGLYGDSDETALETTRKIIKIHPDTVRIYPTIVLKNTDLAALCLDDKYHPQTIEEAVNLASVLVDMFEEADIKVIRLGLHSIEEGAFVEGPWHPAFSELCSSNKFLRMALENLKTEGEYKIYVHPSSVSKMIGQKRANIEKLLKLGFNCRVVADDSVNEKELKIERIG